MGIRTGVLLFVVLVIAALAAFNWGLLATPTIMSLGFMQVTAPFGLIMLGLTALLGIFFVAYVIYLQSTVLMESRRHTKEMQVQRDLADKAEASRFTELRNFLETQENTHMARNAERHAAMLARIEQLEAGHKARAEQTENAIAAHMGQLEDRLDRRQTTSVATAVPVAAVAPAPYASTAPTTVTMPPPV